MVARDRVLSKTLPDMYMSSGQCWLWSWTSTGLAAKTPASGLSTQSLHLGQLELLQRRTLNSKENKMKAHGIFMT